MRALALAAALLAAQGCATRGSKNKAVLIGVFRSGYEYGLSEGRRQMFNAIFPELEEKKCE